MEQVLTIPLPKLESISQEKCTDKKWLSVDKVTGKIILRRDYYFGWKDRVYISPFEFKAKLCIVKNLPGGWFLFVHEEEKDLDNYTEEFFVKYPYLLPFMKNMNNGIIEGTFTIMRTKGGEPTLKFLSR